MPADVASPATAFFRRLPDAAALAPLFDHLPRVYLFVKDREHRFVRVNRAFLLLHGCRTEFDVVGRTDFDFHPPALAAQYVEEDKRVMATGQTLADRAWLVRGADGMPRWYLSTKMPLRDRRGKVVGLAGVLTPYDHAGDAPGDYRRLTPAFEHALAHYGEPVTVGELAERASLSVSQFQRQFRRLFGMTPSDYLLRVRLLAARRQLEQTADPVGTIALRCGFYDQSHFTRAFRAQTGLRPLEYRSRFGPRRAER
ncbi:MAG TPA: helix-turn-helix domain-containing protein [Humisphaera sp.]